MWMSPPWVVQSPTLSPCRDQSVSSEEAGGKSLWNSVESFSDSTDCTVQPESTQSLSLVTSSFQNTLFPQNLTQKRPHWQSEKSLINFFLNWLKIKELKYNIYISIHSFSSILSWSTFGSTYSRFGATSTTKTSTTTTTSRSTAIKN